MIKYCERCLLPNTKPDLSFQDGICSACINYKNRAEIDWDSRKIEFISLIKERSEKTKSSWDCVIPVSGGKDSTYQVLKMLELGFNPLCVTATTCDLSLIGRKNIENIKKLGVDYIEFSPNKTVRKKLNRIGLRLIGDISWPEHVSIFTIPVSIAVKFSIPTIIWGENSQNEYGGPDNSSVQTNVLNRRWLEEFGGLNGLRVVDLIGMEGISKKDLIPYIYPKSSELEKNLGILGIFLGYYFPWDGLNNYIVAQANGFTSYGNLVEGSFVDYENLDNYQTGIHDYFKYLKFGFGRATDIASMFIRRDRLDRKLAVDIVNKIEGKFPKTYLGKSLTEILDNISMDINEFVLICDKFTNREIFHHDSSQNIIKDENGSPIKKNGF